MIFSDMRNAKAMLNLETPHLENPDAMLKKLAQSARIVDLARVTAYALGANGGGKRIRDWATAEASGLGMAA
jgi:hypothetical protein